MLATLFEPPCTHSVPERCNWYTLALSRWQHFCFYFTKLVFGLFWCLGLALEDSRLPAAPLAYISKCSLFRLIGVFFSNWEIPRFFYRWNDLNYSAVKAESKSYRILYIWLHYYFRFMSRIDRAKLSSKSCCMFSYWMIYVLTIVCVIPCKIRSEHFYGKSCR